MTEADFNTLSHELIDSMSHVEYSTYDENAWLNIKRVFNNILDRYTAMRKIRKWTLICDETNNPPILKYNNTIIVDITLISTNLHYAARFTCTPYHTLTNGFILTNNLDYEA